MMFVALLAVLGILTKRSAGDLERKLEKWLPPNSAHIGESE